MSGWQGGGGGSITSPITVLQGTSPWIVRDTSDGSLSGGTPGTTSTLSGGVYNASPLTLLTGQQASLQLDSQGRLIIAPIPITFGGDTDYGLVGSNTLRTAAQIGNQTGAAAFGAGTTTAQVLRVVLPTDQSPINVVTSGTSTVSGTVNTNLNGLNAFASTQMLIGTAPQQVVIPSGTSSVGLKVITTSTSDAVLVGPTSAVTNVIDGTGNGYFLFGGDAVQIDLTPTATVWLVGTSPGQIVGIIFAGG